MPGVLYIQPLLHIRTCNGSNDEMQSALQQTFAYFHCKEGTSCLWDDHDIEKMFMLLPLI